MSANPTVNRRETRAKNATAHPGAILKRTLRRGKEEMEQVRKEADEAAKAAAVKKKKVLTQIAELEQDIASKDSETNRTPVRRQKPPVLKRPMPFHDNAGGDGNKESTTTHRSQPRSNKESQQDSDSSSGERAPVKKKKKVERVRETIKNLSLADKRAERSDREEREQLEVRIDKTVTCSSVNQKKIQIRFRTLMFLRLHEGTLFYFNLRTSNAQTNEKALHVKNWADRVSHVAASTVASDRSRSTTEVSKLKSKSSSTAATMSTKSKSMTAKTADSDEELDSHQPSTLDLMEDENDDEERDAAVSSPIKGRQRLTNAVSISLLSIYMQIVTFP
jgi:hypothetical protein